MTIKRIYLIIFVSFNVLYLSRILQFDFSLFCHLIYDADEFSLDFMLILLNNVELPIERFIKIMNHQRGDYSLKLL